MLKRGERGTPSARSKSPVPEREAGVDPEHVDTLEGLRELATTGDPSTSMKKFYVNQATLHPNSPEVIHAISRAVLINTQDRYARVAGALAGEDPTQVWSSREAVGSTLRSGISSSSIQEDLRRFDPAADKILNSGEAFERAGDFVRSGGERNVDKLSAGTASLVMDVYEAHHVEVPEDIADRLREFSTTRISDYNPSKAPLASMNERLDAHAKSLNEPELPKGPSALDVMLAQVNRGSNAPIEPKVQGPSF